MKLNDLDEHREILSTENCNNVRTLPECSEFISSFEVDDLKRLLDQFEDPNISSSTLPEDVLENKSPLLITSNIYDNIKETSKEYIPVIKIKEDFFLEDFGVTDSRKNKEYDINYTIENLKENVGIKIKRENITNEGKFCFIDTEFFK